MFFNLMMTYKAIRGINASKTPYSPTVRRMIEIVAIMRRTLTKDKDSPDIKNSKISLNKVLRI